jgi:hypothetical protein
MRLRMLRGLSVCAMLLGAVGVGATAHAAPAVNMAKLCSNGAYVLYMDDNGDQFGSEAACAAWTRQHPGQPPIAIDDDPDQHPDQTATTDDTSDQPAATDDTDDTSDQPAATDDTDDTDDSDDQSADAPDATATPTAQMTGGTVLVVVTAPDDDATMTDDTTVTDDATVTDDDTVDDQAAGQSGAVDDDSENGDG